jgi:hypothetical protein
MSTNLSFAFEAPRHLAMIGAQEPVGPVTMRRLLDEKSALIFSFPGRLSAPVNFTASYLPDRQAHRGNLRGATRLAGHLRDEWANQPNFTDFHPMPTLTKSRKVKKTKAQPVDVVQRLALRAERRAGFAQKKMGWLSWFGQVVRGEAALLQKLRDTAKLWPPLEREIFESYFVERLSLADIAVIAGCTAKAFHAHLLFIQCRLRETLIREVLFESRKATAEAWTENLQSRTCDTTLQMEFRRAA